MFPRSLTSSKSNATDSIEKWSLPSTPTHKRRLLKSAGTQNNNSRIKLASRIHSNPVASFQKCKHIVPTLSRRISEHKKILNYKKDIILNKEVGMQSFVHSAQSIQSSFSRLSEENDNLSLIKSDRMDSKAKIFNWNLSDGDNEGNGFIEREVVYLPKLLQMETEFLQLVLRDDVSDVENYINKHPTLNINCTNFRGISALHIAVHNRSVYMVEFLLRHPNVDIGDTVLHAVRDNSIKILAILLDHQKRICPGLEFTGTTHSVVFPSHITPLILAAQCGHYEIVVLLLRRGHSIVRPHKADCCCLVCTTAQVNEDPLHASSARLSAYRAFTSPVYIVHMTSDPIMTTFQLAEELSDNAAADRQLEAAYFQLRDDISAFAVDLIGCCRTSEEVELILKQTTGCRGQLHFVLPRLLMAVDNKQREFVAHPNTQQVLESYWLGDWYAWKRKSSLNKAFILFGRIFIIPIILMMCSVAPQHRLVRHWQIPLNKLITHAASYFVFLGLVFYISNQDKSTLKRGPPNTGVESILMLYVCGYTWSAIRMCLMQGPQRYFAGMWNWAEILMLTLFGLTFVFWITSAIDVAAHGEENLERKYWHQYDSTLLAEGTFCLATIFAFFRLMYLCQLNYHLGPLQVSLGKMTIDIYKYVIVFAIIICAFAAGLARFYQYYDGMVYEDEFGMKTVQVSSFTSLSDTLKTLFWALFCMAPLESADVVLENTRDPRSPERNHENRHGYTERVGYFCFGFFEVILVIVVLNMLIATMSNTFQRVTDNVAIEWTFRRSEVYIQYMLQTTLPSPFNLIPTASGLGGVLDWCRTKIFKPKGIFPRWSPFYCCYMENNTEAINVQEYPVLMSILLQRYFRDKYDLEKIL